MEEDKILKKLNEHDKVFVQIQKDIRLGLNNINKKLDELENRTLEDADVTVQDIDELKQRVEKLEKKFMQQVV
ncbi:MAG: hypothetical protein Q8O88_03135 [bacterium]|nr:hypothetical protein [bacterium]